MLANFVRITLCKSAPAHSERSGGCYVGSLRSVFLCIISWAAITARL
jgi:hypothetical protein